MTVAEELAKSIIDVRLRDLGLKINAYQRRNSILSDITDCERYMCYAVLDWEKRPLHDEDLQARFDAGNVLERQVVLELLHLGYVFKASQMPVQIKTKEGEIIASGRIDGFIEWKGVNVPVEIKTMNLYIFNQIKTVEDFQKKPWLRKYTRQLMMYMYGNNLEHGIFIVTNGLGEWKILPLDLDYKEGEAILQKLERVHESIKKKEYLPRITYDRSVCGKCPFSLQCLPDIINKPADFIENKALEDDISKHEELRESAEEYDSLHKKIRDAFKDIDKAVVGTRWMVMNVPSSKVSYELTDEAKERIGQIKKDYAVQKSVRKLVIQDLDEKVKDD